MNCSMLASVSFDELGLDLIPSSPTLSVPSWRRQSFTERLFRDAWLSFCRGASGAAEQDKFL